MGNNNTSKDSHNSTGSPSDFFSTPPTTPTEAQLAAMAFSSSAFNKKVEQKGTAAGGTTPSTILPTTDWTRRLSASTEWAVISQDAIASPERSGSDAAVSRGTAAGNRSRGSPAEHDSGLGPQTGAEMMTGEETTLVLLSLMEHYRASLGLSPGQDAATGAVELLRRFLVERDDLLVERDGLGEEVRCLKDKLKAEREEWHQFQCDLQVAVAVADRMRAEAEEALAECQRSHRTLEEQLAQTLGTQQDTDRELDGLRAQHRDVCRQLALERGQLQALRAAAHMQTDAAGSDKDAERKDLRAAEGQTMEDEWREGGSRGVPKEEDPEDDETAVAHTGGEAKCNGNHNEVKEKETAQEAHSKAVGQDANGADKGEETQLTGKGVAETYLRSLAVLGRTAENGGSLRDRRKIVMLSERSRSLSRLSLPPNLISQNGTSQCSTLPLCKKEEPTKDGSDHIFQRQESLASFYSKKQEQDPNLDYNKPQDGFSVLLRRHGGSRRNSLLRWCQTRTQGYKNIDITNFSSSWEDGLAFCAVYHTYLPSHIPYGSLCPADKEGNLGLAFQTGESVGITAMLTVEEMLKAGGPDWQRVLGYVDSIFRHFEM